MPKFNGDFKPRGGARPGAGRPTDWLRTKCEKILKKHKLIEFLADVADGKEVERFVTDDGIVVPCPASVKDRQRAIEFLVDRAFGKATENHNVNATVTLENLLGASAE